MLIRTNYRFLLTLGHDSSCVYFLLFYDEKNTFENAKEEVFFPMFKCIINNFNAT